MSGGEWKDSAERLFALVERFITPMIEEQERRRDREKAEELADASVPGGPPPLGTVRALMPPYLGVRYLHPLFAMQLPRRVDEKPRSPDGIRFVECLVLEDGSVLEWDLDTARWVPHSVVPGTEAGVRAKNSHRDQTVVTLSYDQWIAAVRDELASFGGEWVSYAAGIDPADNCWKDPYANGRTPADVATDELESAQ